MGKTTLVRMLSALLGLDFQRVQFTPDLMPSDITGTSVLDLKTNEFEFRRGPIFTQVLLADEINRATPKTQAALLEAMQERQVTVDGATYPLPDPFFVLATQNPIELEGTFPLPEAQLDRFLLRVKLGYPDERDEERILQTRPDERGLPTSPLPDLPPLLEIRNEIAAIGARAPRALATSWRSLARRATIPSSPSGRARARSSRWATPPARSRCSTGATTSCPTT